MEFGVFSASTSYDNYEKIEEKSIFSNSSETIVVAIAENRAREICVSLINTKNIYVVELHILSDTHSYSEALSLLALLRPNEILLHDGSKDKVLSKKICDVYSNDANGSCRILYMSRQYFDQDRGADLLKNVLSDDVDSALLSKYTVLACSYCILRYIENITGRSYAHHSVRVIFGSGENDKMLLDSRTVTNLELICNAVSGDQKQSLFGMIKNTKTIVGERYLKASLLHPLLDIPTLEARFNCTEILIRNNKTFASIAAQLAKLPDLDKMLAGISTLPKSLTSATVKIGVDTLIFLKQTIKIISIINEELKFVTANNYDSSSDEGSKNQLLLTIVEVFGAECFTSLLADINLTLSESTTYSRSAHEMRHQECFAVRPGRSGHLDVCRSSFVQFVEDLHEKTESYSKSYGIPIKVVYNPGRGYYLQIPANVENLPNIFIQSVMNKKTISCTTNEISALSERASEAIYNALRITNDLIQELLDKMRDRMSLLFSLVDCVSLLDMLLSFADLVALSPHPFTRPTLKEDGSLHLDGCRHPISALSQQSSFVENNVTIDEVQNFHLITGPNGSGKSTYIKQIAISVILAQIGCFVPARRAVIPIRDRILTRIGTKDDMENNMSSFHVEMKEAAYIIDNATNKSLIILDELGRGTSNIDGISLSFAIAEDLVQCGAYTFFVTHFNQLNSLAELYPNVRNMNMKTSINVNSNKLEYAHKVVDGPSSIKSGYGITLAESCNLPEVFLQSARAFQKKLNKAFPLILHIAAGYSDQSHGNFSSLYQSLLILKNSTLDLPGLRLYFSNLAQKTHADQLISNFANENEQTSVEVLNKNGQFHNHENDGESTKKQANHEEKVIEQEMREKSACSKEETKCVLDVPEASVVQLTISTEINYIHKEEKVDLKSVHNKEEMTSLQDGLDPSIIKRKQQQDSVISLFKRNRHKTNSTA